MLVQMRPGQVTALIVLSVMMDLSGGCATHPAAGGWKRAEIVVNGMDDEWSGDLLFVDNDSQLAVRMVNGPPIPGIVHPDEQCSHDAKAVHGWTDRMVRPQGG